MVQKGQSHRNRAELSSWAEAQPFKHPSLGLCPKLSSFMLQLQRVCPGASSSQPHRQRRFGEGDPQTALLDCCSDGGTEGAKQGEQALPGLPWVPKRACTSAQHSSRLIAGVQRGLKGLQPGAELLQSKVTSTAHPKLWKITLPTLPGCRQRGWELQSPPPPQHPSPRCCRFCRRRHQVQRPWQELAWCLAVRTLLTLSLLMKAPASSTDSWPCCLTMR